MKPFFSIIIPYHNSKDTIASLLASIYFSKKRPRVEVIIVDDASTILLTIKDLKPSFVRSLAVKIIRFKKNKGPAIARNRGVEQAGGEYIVFLDGDVKLFPDALHNLWKLYTDDPDIHAVTGVWSKEQKSTAFFPNFKALRDWSYWTNERESGHYYYLFSTRIASIRKAIFLRLGGFDESYAGPLIEDIAFTYKIATRYAVIFASNVRVYHEFESFLPIAKKYFLRAYYWTLLFEERRKFDPVATTWKEAVTGISGAALAGLSVLACASLFLPMGAVQTTLWIGVAVLFLGHLYLVRKFLRFIYAEKGLKFTVQSYFMGIVLYCFITAGGVWSLVHPPKNKQMR
ncbi:MAG: glycosyltransferase [Microgenomates group bacterium]